MGQVFVHKCHFGGHFLISGTSLILPALLEGYPNFISAPCKCAPRWSPHILSHLESVHHAPRFLVLSAEGV